MNSLSFLITTVFLTNVFLFSPSTDTLTSTTTVTSSMPLTCGPKIWCGMCSWREGNLCRRRRANKAALKRSVTSLSSIANSHLKEDLPCKLSLPSATSAFVHKWRSFFFVRSYQVSVFAQQRSRRQQGQLPCPSLARGLPSPRGLQGFLRAVRSGLQTQRLPAYEPRRAWRRTQKVPGENKVL